MGAEVSTDHTASTNARMTTQIADDHELQSAVLLISHHPAIPPAPEWRSAFGPKSRPTSTPARAPVLSGHQPHGALTATACEGCPQSSVMRPCCGCPTLVAC